MFGANTFRRFRATVRNALVWGSGWFTLSLAVITVLRLVGLTPDTVSWVRAFGVALRFGVVGAIAGTAFSTVIPVLYRGRRLRDISWVRFGIVGALATGVFVPLFLQLMNVLTGDGMVAWHLVLDDALTTAVFGGIVAGGSLKLAQRAEALGPGASQDQLDPMSDTDRLTGSSERDS